MKTRLDSPSMMTKIRRAWPLAALVALVLALVPLMAGSVAGNATTLYVNPDGTDAGVCPIGSPCKTIQYAINQASAGDTVSVAAGTYDERVTIDKPLTLLGANAGIHPAVGTHPTEIVGERGDEAILSQPGTKVVTLQADDITIDGFKFTGGGSKKIYGYADTNNFHLTNCIFDNDERAETAGVIEFSPGGSLSHTDVVIDFNLFQDKGDATIYTGGSFDRLRIAYNKFNVLGDGVFWTAETLVDGIVEGNEFDGTIDGIPGVGGTGLNIGKGGNIIIRNNWFHDMSYTGFQVGIMGGSVIDNTFEDTYPLFYDGTWYPARAFELWGGEYGTPVSTDVAISGNTIKFNDQSNAADEHGIRLRPGADAPNIHINANNFVDGGVSGTALAVWNQGTGIADAEYNWWGDPNGPYHATTNPGGTGGQVDDDVDYSPWLPGEWEDYFDEAFVEIDSDGDGFSDLEEYWLGTDPEDDADFPGAAVQEVANAYVPEGGTAGTSTTNAAVSAQAAAGESALVNLAEYGASPAPDKPVFGTLERYVDVHTKTPEKLQEVEIRVSYDDSGMTAAQESVLRMYYWDAGAGEWAQCSDQGVNTADNYIWARIRSDTTPDLTYLLGGPFGGGSASVSLDKAWYKAGDVVTVTVEDQVKAGWGTVGVYTHSPVHGQMGPVALAETDDGVFVGAFRLVSATPGVGELLVAHGNTVTVGYPDLTGVEATATVDNVKPTIAIVSPLDGEKVNTARPTIAATLSDALSGIDTATVVLRVDGVNKTTEATVTEASVTYTPAADLSQGSHTVTVDAKDKAGNAATTKTWSFTVDTIKPTITALTPPDSAFVDTATPVISATLADVGTGIDTTTVVIKVGGVNKTSLATVTASSVTYIPPTALSEGSHAVTVDVSDLAGNAATTASWSFTVDTIAPVVTIDELDESTYLPTLTVTGGYVEVNLDSIVVNGVAATIDGDTWTAVVPLVEGDNVITALATDKAGNTGTDSATIEYAPLAVDSVEVTPAEATVLADGVSTTGITVTVEDERDIPIAGKTVTLATTAGIIYPRSKMTDSWGKVTAELTSATSVEVATVTATCDGVIGSTTVSFVADSASMPDLVVGWNLISLPLIPVDSSITAVLDDLGIADDVDVVWFYDAATDSWHFYHPSTGVGELAHMVDGKGYWVKMLAPASGLTVSGFEMPAPGELPRRYAVTTGWNLIGFKSTDAATAEEYLATIRFTAIYGFDKGYHAVSKATELRPGYGYWVYATEVGYIVP